MLRVCKTVAGLFKLRLAVQIQSQARATIPNAVSEDSSNGTYFLKETQ